jgi:hypothetical protein
MADEGMDLGGGDLGVDTPDIETPDSGLETTETPDLGDAGSPDGAEGSHGGAEAAEAKLLVNGKFSPEFQAEMDRLKTEKPAIAKAINKALREVEGYRRAMPNGLKELKDLRAHVERFGGPQGAEESFKEFAAFRDLDAQFGAGDPRFVEAMIKAEPNAFLKLGPVIFDKYKELHPDGFKSFVAKNVVGEMEKQGFTLSMMRLRDLIGDNPKAMEYFNAAANVFDRLSAEAEKQVELPKPKQDDLAAERQQIADQRAQLELREWGGDAGQILTKIYNSEFSRQLTALKLSPDKVSATDRAEIQERMDFYLKQAVQRNSATTRAFFDARDRDGYKRHMTQFYGREVPRALQRAIAKTVPESKKAAPAPGVKPAPQPGFGRPAAAAAGYTMVAKRPEAFEIDPLRTSKEDFFAKQATLKSGKKVTWR